MIQRKRLILATFFTTFFLFQSLLLSANPIRTIDGIDTVIRPTFNFIIQEDLIYTQGYINELELRTRIRCGFNKWFEGMGAFSLSFFPDIYSTGDLYQPYYENLPNDEQPLMLGNPRISYLEGGLKIRTVTLGYDTPVFLNLGYKHFPGIPIIVDYPETGNDEDAIAVTASNASMGKEVTAGLYTNILLSDISQDAIPSVTVGVNGVYIMDRDWMREGRDGKLMFGVEVSPQLLFLRKWKLQLESRAEWWVGRGWHFEIIPGIRWETYPNTVVEAAIGIPMSGGDVTRNIVGYAIKLGENTVRIRVYNILFPPDSPNIWGFSDEDQIKSNERALDQLITQIQGYPDYDILIEGHTASVHWADPKAFEWEQENEMLPLSKARAEAVRKALVDRGLDPRRVVATGKGGSEPVVDHSRTEEMWKNRRVEVVLTKRRIVKSE